MLLMRLALIPMNLINASCALSPTPARTYALACLVLIPRFSVLLIIGRRVGRSLRLAEAAGD